MMETNIPSAHNFFSSLDLSLIDTEVGQYITEHILPHVRLGNINVDNKEYRKLYAILHNTFPFACISYNSSDQKDMPDREELSRNLGYIETALKSDPENRMLIFRKKIINDILSKAQ